MPAFEYVSDAETDPLRRGKVPQVLSAETHLAARHLPALRRQQAGDGLERRALAGAVGAQKGDRTSLGDLERDALDREEDLIVHDLDVFECQHCVIAKKPTAS